MTEILDFRNLFGKMAAGYADLLLAKTRRNRGFPVVAFVLLGGFYANGYPRG